MGSLHNADVGLRVRRPDHIDYADVSERVATSDLKKLVEVGLLRAVGDPRAATTWLVSAFRISTGESRRNANRSPILSKTPPEAQQTPASRRSGPRLGRAWAAGR